MFQLYSLNSSANLPALRGAYVPFNFLNDKQFVDLFPLHILPQNLHLVNKFPIKSNITTYSLSPAFRSPLPNLNKHNRRFRWPKHNDLINIRNINTLTIFYLLKFLYYDIFILKEGAAINFGECA